MNENDSILISVKTLCGIDKDNHDFDQDILMHINAVLMIANQLGVGVKPITVVGDGDVWSDLGVNERLTNLLKTYVGWKVRMLFDPPTTGSVNTAGENAIKELEFRIYSEADFSD